MYADLILFSEPRRPIINPKFDLFAFLDVQQYPPLFPAKVVDKIQLTLPEKCRYIDCMNLPEDIWDFISWQVDEHGFIIVRSIDKNWWYWSVAADKITLLNMMRFL